MASLCNLPAFGPFSLSIPGFSFAFPAFPIPTFTIAFFCPAD